MGNWWVFPFRSCPLTRAQNLQKQEIYNGHYHLTCLQSGRAVARIPRVSGGGTHRAGQAAFGNQCRSGRMFAPTKVWRKWHQKVNVGQRYGEISFETPPFQPSSPKPNPQQGKIKLTREPFHQTIRNRISHRSQLRSSSPPRPRPPHLNRARSATRRIQQSIRRRRLGQDVRGRCTPQSRRCRP